MRETIACSGLMLRLQPGPVFHANERLASGVLAEAALIEGLPCAAEEEVEFHDDGRLACAILAADCTVNGLPARGGAPVAFYPDGSVRFVVLARPRSLRGFPTAAGKVFMHPDGAVWNALSSAEAALGRRLLPAATRVTLDPDGALLEFWRTLDVDTEIQGLPCSARFPVWFYADGRLSCLHLAQPCRVAGRRFAAETEIVFGRDGEVAAAYLRRYPRSSAVSWRVFGALDAPLYG